MPTKKECPMPDGWTWDEIDKPNEAENGETSDGCWNCNELNLCPFGDGDAGWSN